MAVVAGTGLLGAALTTNAVCVSCFGSRHISKSGTAHACRSAYIAGLGRVAQDPGGQKPRQQVLHDCLVCRYCRPAASCCCSQVLSFGQTQTCASDFGMLKLGCHSHVSPVLAFADGCRWELLAVLRCVCSVSAPPHCTSLERLGTSSSARKALTHLVYRHGDVSYVRKLLREERDPRACRYKRARTQSRAHASRQLC